MISFLYSSTPITSSIQVHLNGITGAGLTPTFSGFLVRTFPLPLHLLSIGLFLYILVSLHSFFTKKIVHIFTLFSEKELNSIDDLVVILALSFSFFGLYIFSMFGALQQQGLVFTIIVYLVVNAVFIALILLTMIYNFNYYFITYINGSGSSLSIIYEFILDVTNLLAFNLRLCVQLVRIVILFGVYFMLSMVFYEIPHTFTAQTTPLTLGVVYLRLVFEVAHTLVIFAMQCTAFLFMVFWLFQFLMTCFTPVFSENSSYKTL